MSRTPARRAGGCLCGAVRYRVSGPAVDAGYCHCRSCRRSAGAPVAAWATFPIAALAFTRGEPAAYRSSRRAVRHFCARCGTQLTYRRAVRPETVDVTLASLDRPERLPPEYHLWTASRLPWFDVRDRLPRHRGEPATAASRPPRR